MSFQQSEFLIDRIEHSMRYDMPAYSQKCSVIHALEAEFSLLHLQLILQNTLPSQTQSALKNFLKNRWHFIRDTDIQYVHDFQSPANQMCIRIARLLHELTGQSTLGLLMPSLKQVSPDSYIISSYLDESLDLRHLVLSDDNSRLIHIIDTLDFAINDGVLKHTALFNKKTHHLSAREVARLLSRHPSVSDFFEAIKSKVQFEFHGETLGAHLRRLIKGLEEGNVDHNGTEMDAGVDANIAIIEFAAMLETLSCEKRQLLMGANKLYESNSTSRSSEYAVQDAWSRLQRLERHSGVNIGMTCVKLIGSDLQDILETHPELYTIPTFDAPELGSSLGGLKEQVAVLREAMMLSLPDLEFHVNYGAQFIQKLTKYLCDKLHKNPQFILNPRYIAWVFETMKTEIDTTIIQDCRLILEHIMTTYTESTLRLTHQSLNPELASEFEKKVLHKRSLTSLTGLQTQSIFKKIKSEPIISAKHLGHS